ncbi:hypothetical protein [Streptomyces sp. NPDC088812]|uniref:hypothetical protein n=1 Tax=Streptomyces sp. NPDC088812 TaxID=3365905 RepID=UPI0038063A9C
MRAFPPLAVPGGSTPPLGLGRRLPERITTMATVLKQTLPGGTTLAGRAHH